MSELEYSGVMLEKCDVKFGIVTPARRLFKLAVAVFDKSTYYVLQNLHLRPELDQSPEQQLARLAEGQFNMAKGLYAEKIAEKFLPELMAYVRTLPADARSQFLDSSDEWEAQTAERELYRALVQALRFDDEYRAAVEMEKVVAYLVPDRNILPVMRSFIDEYQRTFVARPHMQEVAIRTQRELLESSLMMRTVVAGMKQDEPDTTSFGVR